MIPQNLTVTATGKRSLSVSWEPPLFMGKLASLLCYKILYAPAHGKNNESMEISAIIESKMAKTISNLYPYTEYTFYIHCSLPGCYGGWGLFGGPVTMRTNAEAPAKAPEFQNSSSSRLSRDKRDVTVVWKLPPSNTWNGIPNGFNIDIWQLSLEENGSLTPLPNSSRRLHIDDGNATNATLSGLSLFADYQTQISMCTAEGCGPKSVPLPLLGEKKPNPAPIYGPSDDSVSVIFVGIVAGAIVLLVAIAVGCFFGWRCRTNGQNVNMRQQPPLEDIIELENPLYGNQEDSTSSRTHSYDEIPPTEQRPIVTQNPLYGNQEDS